jgi:hypothetical protein
MGQKGNGEGTLPIVGMDNMGEKAQKVGKRQQPVGPERKAEEVVRVFASGLTIETRAINQPPRIQRIDGNLLPAQSPLKHPKALRPLGSFRHKGFFQGKSRKGIHSPKGHGPDPHIHPQCRQCQGERAGDIGQPSRLGHRRNFGSQKKYPERLVGLSSFCPRASNAGRLLRGRLPLREIL